jgi:hypothetical protein
MIKTIIVTLVATITVIAISEPVQAARIRCGSSWDVCAQRGKGPGAKQGVIQPRGNQQQR